MPTVIGNARFSRLVGTPNPHRDAFFLIEDTSSVSLRLPPVSLRLGHRTALALLMQFTTVLPLRYPLGKAIYKLRSNIVCEATSFAKQHRLRSNIVCEATPFAARQHHLPQGNIIFEVTPLPQGNKKEPLGYLAVSAARLALFICNYYLLVRISQLLYAKANT